MRTCSKTENETTLHLSHKKTIIVQHRALAKLEQ